MIKLFNSLLVDILFQNSIFLCLQVHGLSLNKCQLLLTVNKGLSDHSGSSTKVFAPFPYQVLWKFPNLEFKQANKPWRIWLVYVKKHFIVGTGSCRGCLTKITTHRERVNTICFWWATAFPFVFPGLHYRQLVCRIHGVVLFSENWQGF